MQTIIKLLNQKLATKYFFEQKSTFFGENFLTIFKMIFWKSHSKHKCCIFKAYLMHFPTRGLTSKKSNLKKLSFQKYLPILFEYLAQLVYSIDVIL